MYQSNSIKIAFVSNIMRQGALLLDNWGVMTTYINGSTVEYQAHNGDLIKMVLNSGD